MAKIGRNEPCPCGSGKKYKKCCLPLLSPSLSSSFVVTDGSIPDQICAICDNPATSGTGIDADGKESTADAVIVRAGDSVMTVHFDCLPPEVKRSALKNIMGAQI